MKKPLISIITVCYNAEKEIETTLKSVTGQTFTDREYIIIDGESSDRTLEIIQQYRQKIDILVSEPDKGIYDAMNKGVKYARGEWIIMMNAGDVFANNNVLEDIFKTDIPSNISCIYSDIYMYDKKGRKYVCPLDFSNGGMIHQAMIYKKSLHERFGPYIVTKPIIISDYLFFIRFPLNEIMKTSTIISIYEGGGVSSHGNWTRQQSLCADVVFRRRTFRNMIVTYVIRQISDYFPIGFKNKIKRVLIK
ncbi:MAG: glycosyltransferase [Prevotella sp.]|jgi:glycosyltransferase involved in cell wall biosynthesis|nr:glycosyltransferase [Prevotella sp.]